MADRTLADLVTQGSTPQNFKPATPSPVQQGPDLNDVSGTQGFQLTDPQPDQQGHVDMFPSAPVENHTDSFLDAKANKYAKVLDQPNASPDSIKNDLARGDQTSWDWMLKNQTDAKNYAVRTNLINEWAHGAAQGKVDYVTASQVVNGLSNDELHSADVAGILEKKYADLFTSQISDQALPVVQNALKENPDAALDTMDGYSKMMAQKQIASGILDEVNKEAQDEGWISWGAGFLKEAVPGATWFRGNNAVEGTNGPILPGENLDAQVGYLNSLPVPVFEAKLREAVRGLQSGVLGTHNQAQRLLQAFIAGGVSDNDMLANNVIEIGGNAVNADIAKSLLTATGKLGKGLLGSAKGVLVNPTDTAQIAAEAGGNSLSAIKRTIDDAAAGDVSGVTSQVASTPQKIESLVPSIYAPQKAFTESTTMDAAANSRLRAVIEGNGDLMQKFMDISSPVDVQSQSQLAQSVVEAQSRIKDMFSNVQHNVIDMASTPAEADTLTNRAHVQVRFGEKDGSLFSSPERAENFARENIMLKTNDYSIEQKGMGGYYIQVERPVANVGQFRDVSVPTDIADPDSVSNRWLRMARSADYRLSQENVMARGRVVHTREGLHPVIEAMAKPFSGKSSEWYDELGKVMKSNRTNQKWFDNVDDFETEFRKLNGHAPDDDHYAGYYAYRQLNDLDYVTRNLDVRKQLTDLGAERIQFREFAPDETSKTRDFNGIVKQDLPWNAKTAFDVQVQNADGELTKYSSRFLVGKQRDNIQKLIAEKGYQVVHGEDGTYYLLKNFKRDNVKLDVLPYKAGGHYDYRKGFFLKQGIVSTGKDGITRLTGDRAFGMALSEKQARQMVDTMNEARNLVREQDPGARQFIETKTPFTYQEFQARVAKGEIDVNHPFVFTRTGQRTTDVMNYRARYGDEKFIDSFDPEHNPFNSVRGKYLTEKSETALDVLKAENDVIARSDGEALLDPFDTLRNTMSDMVNTRVMNDYITKSTSDWTQQFGDLLDVDPNKLKSNPLYYMFNPVFKAGAEGGKVSIAKSTAQAITSFAMRRTPESTAWDNAIEKMLSKTYDVTGSQQWRDAVEKGIYMATDVPSFIRSATFVKNLGLLNPKSLFTQASQAAVIMAASPVASIKALRASFITNLAGWTENEAVIRGMLKKFPFHGWDADEYMEMMNSYKRSGFSTVSSKSYFDDFRPRSLANGKFAKAVEFGNAPFNLGEQISRDMAYPTAYTEWKTANPGKALTRFDESQILQRAKDLTGNMTRDSFAQWQTSKGLSLATQFMGYQARFFEQLWDGGLFKSGRKLSAGEKARVMTMMSIMYGAPAAIGGATLFPWKSWIHEQMANAGIDTKDNVALDNAVNGVMPVIFNAMTGARLDFGNSYGPNGIDQLRDLFNNDTTWQKLFLGASNTTIGDTLASTANFAQGVMDIFNKDNPTTWPVLIEQSMEPFQTIGTVKNATKLWEAVNTHRYLAKDGTLLANPTTSEAIASFLSGAQLQSVSDAYAKLAVMKSNKESTQEVQKNYSLLVSKGMDAINNGDEASAEYYFSKSKQLARENNMSITDMLQAGSRALSTIPLTQGAADLLDKRVAKRNAISAANSSDTRSINEGK